MLNLKNKKISVLGFGVEGESVVRFLKNLGVAEISIYSEKEIPSQNKEIADLLIEEGVKIKIGPFGDLSQSEVIIRSPSIRPDIDVLNSARNKGCIVTSATNLFIENCPCKIIGVTGTKGKGTTSTLIYEMLKNDGFDAYLGGNIGIPPLDFLSKLTKDSIVVLELSSFQLWDITKSPHVGVLVMTTSEHLDIHRDLNEYLEAKSRLFLFQNNNDFAVLNMDFINAKKIEENIKSKIYKTSITKSFDYGCYIKNNSIVFNDGDREEEIILLDKIFIPGKHNWQNGCSAVCAAKILNVSNFSIIKTLENFKGLEHRLEFVTLVNGVKYYDDSFSTTPETAIAAIEAFREQKVLILGGSSKNSDFTELGNLISKSKSIRAIIGIGVEWRRIKEKIEKINFPIYENCSSMDEIIDTAVRIAQNGDVVLLSPACASFGMFKNYKDRGEQFKKRLLKF